MASAQQHVNTVLDVQAAAMRFPIGLRVSVEMGKHRGEFGIVCEGNRPEALPTDSHAYIGPEHGGDKDPIRVPVRLDGFF